MKCDICFFGNSLTYNANFQDSFPDISIVNLGYPGDNLSGMRTRVPMIKALNPKAVFIMGGINDLPHVSVDECIQRYNSLLHEIKDSIPNCDIYVQSILPVNHSIKKDAVKQQMIIDANKVLSEQSTNLGYTYIDLYSHYSASNELSYNDTKDGLHLLPNAYNKWYEAIAPFVSHYTEYVK